jgi:uncharacterized protein (DUF362 family)
MSKSKVAIVRYEKPLESVRRAVELSGGLEQLPRGGKVVIKPNIVYWTSAVPFPKYGVITTSRVIEDMVVILKEHGIDDITIAEGIVTAKPKDFAKSAHAFEYLGYNKLKERYGIKTLNVFEGDFEEVDLGAGVKLNMSRTGLESDFVVDVPVMKTHAQTTVSLGIKNIKGWIDIESRKKCHSADDVMDLDYMIARLPNRLPPMFVLIDGIYSLERGPSFDGKAHRTNLLVASSDVLSADLVGARVLGHDPADIRYLGHAAQDRGRPTDLSDVELVGEPLVESVKPHRAFFEYNEDDTLPLPMAKMGIQGVSYKKYDNTLCTYCSGINGVTIAAIAMAWKGEPWDDVEILTGKKMAPTPGKKKTILLGRCMWEKYKDSPEIRETIGIKGCPPVPKTVVKALHEAGIEVDPNIFENIEMAPGFFMAKYKDKPGFEEEFFQVD